MKLSQLVEVAKKKVDFKDLPFPIVKTAIKEITDIILGGCPDTPSNRNFAEYKAERFVENVFHELMDIDSEEELNKLIKDFSDYDSDEIQLWIDNLSLNISMSEKDDDDDDEYFDDGQVASIVAEYFEEEMAPDLEKNWETYKAAMLKHTGVKKEFVRALTWTDLEKPAEDEREVLASYKGYVVAMIVLKENKWKVQLVDGAFGVPKRWKGVHIGFLSQDMAETLGIKYVFATLPEAKKQVELYASEGGIFLDVLKKQPKIADIEKKHGSKKFH